jgi:iron complex outermembrane recepter protein
MGSAAYTADDSSKHFEIKAKPLADALMEFGVQSGLTVVAPTTLTAGKKAAAIRGDFAPTDALGRLLKGSGLSFARAADGTIAIQAIPSNKPVQASAAESRLDNDLTRATDSLQEVVVTAEKRKERLSDVPAPVSALSATQLADANQTRLSDYFTSIPGLIVSPAIQSSQTLAIRGVTTAGSNPTVGVTIDDIPYGPSTGIGGGQVVPDFDPGDLERVEVLRGPQGTLYGASSLGGLIKYVTKDPSTQALSGRFQANTEGVTNGGGPGYGFRGSINAPLADDMAIRVSVFGRHDAGYIDNVQTGQNGINSDQAYGGRMALMWKPSDALSIKLNALYQDVKGDGSDSVDPALGDLKQSRLLGTGIYDRSAQLYSATVEAHFGTASLVSTTGYGINYFKDSLDYSYALADFSTMQYGAGGDNLISANRAKKFTEELRFSMPLGSHVDWLAGAFFTNEDSVYNQDVLAERTSDADVVGSLLSSENPTTFKELAGFTDLTVHVTQAFDIQAGVRGSGISQTFSSQAVGALAGGDTDRLDTRDSSVTHLATARYKITPDLMTYLRISSGYTAGGANANLGVPPAYGPQNAEDYEVGLKGSFLDHRLFIDSSIYYIDFNHIQVDVVLPSGFDYIANGSKAKSTGVELSVEAKPWSGMAVDGWVTWDEANLVEDFPAGSSVEGRAGDRLPLSSRWSGHASLEQSFDVSRGFEGFGRIEFSYVGNRIGVFESAGTDRQYYAGYGKVDLRAGVRRNEWSGQLYINNLNDARAALYGGLGSIPPTSFTYIRPRTIGLSLVYAF